MKKLILALWVLVLAACPGGTNCKGSIDVYTVARASIAGAQVAVGAADAVFQIWAAAQKDPEKVKKALEQFLKVKLDVLDGLQLASAGVDIAEQAHVDPDLNKLLDKAEVAFQALRKLLTDLLSSTPSTQVAKMSVAINPLLLRIPKTLLRR